MVMMPPAIAVVSGAPPEATVRAAPPTLLHAARDTLRSALRALATRTQRPDRGAYTALEMA